MEWNFKDEKDRLGPSWGHQPAGQSQGSWPSDKKDSSIGPNTSGGGVKKSYPRKQLEKSEVASHMFDSISKTKHRLNQILNLALHPAKSSTWELFVPFWERKVPNPNLLRCYEASTKCWALAQNRSCLGWNQLCLLGSNERLRPEGCLSCSSRAGAFRHN